MDRRSLFTKGVFTPHPVIAGRCEVHECGASNTGQQRGQVL